MSLTLLRCHCGSKFVANTKCNQCGILITSECFKCHNGSFVHIQNRNARRYSIPKGNMVFASGLSMIWISLFMVGTMLGIVLT